VKFNVIATEKKADAGVAEAITHLTRVLKAAQTLDVSLAAVDNRLGNGVEIPQPLLGKIHSTDEFKAYLVRVQREVADLAVAVEQFINQR
jgi:hypothetical protein